MNAVYTLTNIKAMRTKATTLPIRSEKISAFKFALDYQKIDSFKCLELQTKELSTRSFSCSPSFTGSFTRFLVRSFSPAFLVCSVVSPFAQFFLLVHEQVLKTRLYLNYFMASILRVVRSLFNLFT